MILRPLRKKDMCANSRVHHDPMVVFFCFYITLPHYHLYSEISESIEYLKACQVHSVECMSPITSILSIICQAIYGAVCIDDCEDTRILSYLNLSYLILSYRHYHHHHHHHHQIGSMDHLLSVRLWSWNTALFVFCVVTDMGKVHIFDLISII